MAMYQAEEGVRMPDGSRFLALPPRARAGVDRRALQDEHEPGSDQGDTDNHFDDFLMQTC